MNTKSSEHQSRRGVMTTDVNGKPVRFSLVVYPSGDSEWKYEVIDMTKNNGLEYTGEKMTDAEARTQAEDMLRNHCNRESLTITDEGQWSGLEA